MEGGQPIRVLVVDDHRMFTDALTTVLDQDGRFVVVGTAATGREAGAPAQLTMKSSAHKKRGRNRKRITKKTMRVASRDGTKWLTRSSGGG